MKRTAALLDAKAPAMAQGDVNPFYYINGITVNPWDNSNPAGCIQVKRPYTILQNATEWDLAIIRATYPMNGAPLGVCPISGGINTTPMTFYLVRAGTTYAQSVVWTPEYTDQAVPTSYSPQDLSTRYYYYSSVASLLKCFNTALAAASTSAGATNPAVVTYDPASGLFSILYPSTDFGSTAATPCVLKWNQATAQFLSNFAGQTAASIFAPSIPTTTNYLANNGINYIQLLQECPNITAWDSMGAITMTTDLGIVQEDVATSMTSFVGSSTTQSPQITDILCDSGVGTLAGGTRSGIVEYLPQSTFRWINLRTTQFTGFNLFLSWTTKGGAIFPLVLPPGTQATVKIVFRHRSARGGDVY